MGAAYFGYTGKGLINAGTATVAAGAGVLFQNGMPQTAVNTLAETVLDFVDKPFVPEFAQQSLDQQIDNLLSGIEDATGILQNTCHS